MPHPFVTISTAMSVDGQIDDLSSAPLILSNAADFDQVDALRAAADAILIGAGTIRADDPKLLVRSEARRQARLAQGLPAHPRKVTLTNSGTIDPRSQFFQLGECEKIVYCAAHVRGERTTALRGVATVVETAGPAVDPDFVLADLYRRGVRRLLIEGGSATNSLFLSAGLVDALRLAVAPFFVGEPGAPPFVKHGVFPHDQHQRMNLRSIEQLGDMAVLHYVLEHRA